jgi:hypothetical protein
MLLRANLMDIEIKRTAALRQELSGFPGHNDVGALAHLRSAPALDST